MSKESPIRAAIEEGIRAVGNYQQNSRAVDKMVESVASHLPKHVWRDTEIGEIDATVGAQSVPYMAAPAQGDIFAQGVDLQDLTHLAEGLEQVEQAVTGMFDFREGELVLRWDERTEVTATYQDRTWRVSIKPVPEQQP